jgi:hypothetical protein
MSRCKSCGAEIDWVKTSTGKSMPLDIGRRLGGNVDIGDDGIAQVKPSLPDVKRFVSHFTTCPDADSFRRTS